MIYYDIEQAIEIILERWQNELHCMCLCGNLISDQSRNFKIIQI